MVHSHLTEELEVKVCEGTRMDVDEGVKKLWDESPGTLLPSHRNGNLDGSGKLEDYMIAGLATEALKWNDEDPGTKQYKQDDEVRDTGFTLKRKGNLAQPEVQKRRRLASFGEEMIEGEVITSDSY